MDYTPYHQPDDTDKLASLTDALAQHGWVGAPLVAWDSHLLTGSHRYAAALSLDWPISSIPVVDIRDLFAADDLDFDALAADEGITDITDSSLPWLVNHCLTSATRDLYGLDLH